MKALLAVIAFVLAVLSAGTSAFAHGGGLDAYRCHNDNVHGGYHCH